LISRNTRDTLRTDREVFAMLIVLVVILLICIILEKTIHHATRNMPAADRWMVRGAYYTLQIGLAGYLFASFAIP
jgi:hypothetical protein